MMLDNYLIVLACTVLFALRVFGQIVVVTKAPPWLPANEHWYSGLMPYRYLLPGQLFLLAIMASITLHLIQGRGAFAADGGLVLLRFCR